MLLALRHGGNVSLEVVRIELGSLKGEQRGGTRKRDFIGIRYLVVEYKQVIKY